MNASTMSQSSQDPERMDVLSQIIGYILEPLLHAAPYPYIALHPVLTAARHVQSFQISASVESETRGIMSRETNPSMVSVIYPTKGIFSWIVWSFSQTLAQRYLAKPLSMHITKCLTAIVFAPLHLLWLQSALSDTSTPMKASMRYIRSITAIQWLRFVAAIVAFTLIEESIEFVLEQSFQIFIGYKDFMAELDTDQARYLSTVLMGFYFLSKAVKLFLWVPATVAAVHAVPRIDAERSNRRTQEFWADMISCLKSMPFTLWWRFGIYYGVAAVIDASSRVVDATFHINIVRGGLEDSI